MKIKLFIICMFLAACKGKDEWPMTATIHNMGTFIPVPEGYRDIGFDSIQLLIKPDGKIEANFCYYNTLRFKKDTVYTNDTAYRRWATVLELAPEIYVAGKYNKLWKYSGHSMGGDSFCDSLNLDSFHIVVTKIKK